MATLQPNYELPDSFPQGLRYITKDVLQQMLSFPADMRAKITPRREQIRQPNPGRLFRAGVEQLFGTIMQRREFIQVSHRADGPRPSRQGLHAQRPIPGEIVGANSSIGHLLRNGMPTGAPIETIPCEVAIIGGGISGLSAARWLKRNGITDIHLLDLEDHVGGNASSGHNAVSAYPWGAHYIPTPNNELHDYLQFLETAGVITGYDSNGLPIYNEYYLCFDPHERLYLNGSWQTDLIPRLGLPAADTSEIARLLKQMEQFGSPKAVTDSTPSQSQSIPPAKTHPIPH